MWLEEHLDSFVKPYLGTIPPPNDQGRWSQAWLDHLIKAWAVTKEQAKGRTVLLPGRDVWELEILARIDEYPTIFRPDISSLAVGYILNDFRHCYCVDSGYSGSIPRKLGIQDFGLISTEGPHQLPGVYKPLCGHLEGNYKYWVRAQAETYGTQFTQDFECRIVQTLAPKENFTKAAGITQVIALYYMKKKGLK